MKIEVYSYSDGEACKVGEVKKFPNLPEGSDLVYVELTDLNEINQVRTYTNGGRK